jgi:L-alanine-DL-glutamate epimerase-like enolase superfamily enzyme
VTDLGQLRIVGVYAAEVRGVPFSVGFVPPWSPDQSITTRDHIVVRIDTNAGISGFSMDSEYTPYGIPATARQIETQVAPHLLGKQVASMEAHTALLHSVSGLGRFFFLEVALWDIIGKAVGLPLCQLWGGECAKMPVYASTVHHGKPPQQRAEDCLAYRERGFRGVKLRLSAPTLSENLELVAACRAAVGEEMAIMVDANQAGRDPTLDEPATWDLDLALDTAYHLAQLGVTWLEEPLPYALVHDGARLRQESSVPIAGGECAIGVRAFGKLVQSGLYDLLQPDPITGGTPTDMRKIISMSECHDIPVVFHHGKSGVGLLMGLHLSAVASRSPWLEYMDDGSYYQPEGFQVGFAQPLPLDGEGYVHCPQAPGLGADWDPAWLKQIGLR